VVTNGTLKFHFHIFPQLTQPNGYLSPDKRAQACWFFYTRAQSIKEIVGTGGVDSQIILEGELWMDKRYEQLARTVAMMYGLDSPDEFAKCWDQVKAQTRIMNLPEPDGEYMNPCRRVLFS
jgi:hypothetical protein